MRNKTYAYEGEFTYSKAFSRNLGWITEAEQAILATKKVGIAGMGGVGGQYVEVLARLGITKFHLADFDEFEVQNFNRQNCSGIINLHKKKVEVLRDKIFDINPLAEVKIFSEGINSNNIDTFLEGIDLYLDGLDFFVLDIRRLVFEKAHQKKIAAITVAPIGMGAALIVFDQTSMTFAEHFGIKENEAVEVSAVKFLTGLAPTLKHVKYLADKTRGNFKEKRAPSLPMGPYLCAGIAGSEALKILLKRNNIKTSPWCLHFDAYLQSYSKTYLWWGHKNPLQKFKFSILAKALSSTNHRHNKNR